MTPFSIRIAATADLHIRTQGDLSYLHQAFHDLHDEADILVIAGDLTDLGRVAEMELLAEVLEGVSIPIFITFGNHDRRGMRQSALKKVLRKAGVTVLEGSGAIATLPDNRSIGIAGVTGTGGGFSINYEQFGPSTRFTRAVTVRSRRESARLRKALRELRAQDLDLLIVLSHFSPTTSTLDGEPPLKYWMLGNALLGRTIDEFEANLVIHGHAHLGYEIGATENGTPVHNVALPVVGGIRLLEVSAGGEVSVAGVRRIDSPLLSARIRQGEMRR